MYSSAIYQTARRIRLEMAGGRCERIRSDGSRCPEGAREANHTIDLETAQTYAEALELCRWELLAAVCVEHNPRGGHRPDRRRVGSKL